MNRSPRAHPVDTQRVLAVVNRLFPVRDIQIERVMSGISTYVYRIFSQGQTYYLRVLPDAEGSFTPEIAALTRLRQLQVNVPEIIHYEDHNRILGRPIMLETEIKGRALSQSSLPREVLAKVVVEAGRDLARINSLTVEGFGWVNVRRAQPARLRAQWPTFRAFVLSTRVADLAYLRAQVLKAEECARLERVLACLDTLLDEIKQGYLAHGDFDSTHIFQDHVRVRDGARPPFALFQELERGYAEIVPLPPNYEPVLLFTSMLINLRALSRAFQTRPPDQYIWRQLEMLRADLVALS
jgi:fructosamine-3-kinase